jgi:hypothetical protein
MAASKKAYIRTFIKKEAASEKDKAEGLGLVDRVESSMKAVKAVDKQLKKRQHDRNLIAQQKTAVDQLTTDLSSLTSFLGKLGKPIKLPTTKITYTKSRVSAEHLSSETPPGSTPSATDVPGYRELRAAGFTAGAARKDNWVRMHVLNKHLGGSGSDKHNLVMGPSSVNLGPDMKGFEGKLKQLLKPKSGSNTGRYAVAWMEGVKFSRADQTLTAPNGTAIPTGLLTRQIKYSGGFYKQKSETKWTRQPATISTTVDVPLPDVDENIKPSLRTATPLLLKNAYVRAGLGSYGRADAAFKSPAVPQLRDTYPSHSAVLARIPQLNISSGQKANLLSVMRALLNAGAVDL